MVDAAEKLLCWNKLFIVITIIIIIIIIIIINIIISINFVLLVLVKVYFSYLKYNTRRHKN